MWSPAEQVSFDPFDHTSTFDDVASAHQGTVASKTPKTSGQSRGSRGSKRSGASSRRAKSPGLRSASEEGQPKALPPRLVVKLALHEEVSSTAILDHDEEGESLSQLAIEGRIVAQVESTNANEGTPFSVEVSGPMLSLAAFTPKEYCKLVDEEATVNGTIETVRCTVGIPKSVATGCEILSYSMNVRTQNMPILVQAKAVLVKSNVCRVSVQIRSNLSNEGDLADFCIVVAIPATTLKGETLKVTRGDCGVWDSNKRIVSWKVGDLPHGESRLVSCEAEVSPTIAQLLHDNPFAPEAAEGRIRCPVLVRCTSRSDKVSDLVFRAAALEGKPATIVAQGSRGYRLLHRAGTDRK